MFNGDPAHIQTRLGSSLALEQACALRRQSRGREGYIGRPLFADEPLDSNVCVLHVRQRRSECPEPLWAQGE